MSPQPYRDEEPDRLIHIPPLTDDEEDDEDIEDQNMHIRSPSVGSAAEDGHGRMPLPIWLRESAKSFRFKWVPLPLRKAGRAIAKWSEGPQPPRELKIVPYFARIQEAPLKLLDRYAPKQRHRWALLIALLAAWFLTWSLMLKAHATSGYIEGYGKPSNIWCGASFWREGNGCGVNGNDCRPFANQYLPFRCPANCRSVQLLEERIVGNMSLQYEGLVIGGPAADDPDQRHSRAIYRADSFICQAAIHAGAIKKAGGCGVAVLVGAHAGYDGTKQHGIQSTPFPATFPRSYTFTDLTDEAQCPTDSRWPLFGVTAGALVILSLFTTSPAAFFFGTFFIMMFQVGLVSDPPNLSSFADLLSTLLAKLLPAAFVAVIVYRYCAVPLLAGLTAQVEKTVLYLGFCFIGCLNNYTFAPLIPISRLTPHDLAQPGAKFALAMIVTIVLVIVITQIYWIRLTGKFRKYLAIYVAMGLTLVVLVALPGLRLRIHHYILALLFLPGTGFQTRPSLVYQGLLLGLFINGIARWGFASIVQTPSALGEAGGGQGGSWWGSRPPNVTATVAPNADNITFTWGALPRDTGVDGVSILVNDVERWRGYLDEELFYDPERITLRRRDEGRSDDSPAVGRTKEAQFYRFAWMNGNDAGRYSRVGVWDENDMWHSIPTD